jgi:replicative DNA helicase
MKKLSPAQIDYCLSAKGLPASLEAERLTLGALLIESPDVQAQIVSECSPAWFTLAANALIFETASEIFRSGEPLDRVMVAQKLVDAGQVENVGGLSYLMGLDEGIPRFMNVGGYMGVLRDKWVRRQAITAGYAIIQQALDPGDGEAINATLERYMELSQPPKRGGLVSAGEHAKGCGIEELFAANSELGGIELPWLQLSGITGQLLPDQMTTIAAPTGTGKSSFLRQIIAAAAMAGKCVALFSLEMSRAEVLRAMSATLSGVDSRRIDRGQIGQDERLRLARVFGELEGQPIYIDEESSTTTAIDAALRKLSARRPVDLIAIDHFHLLSDPPQGNRTETLKLASNRLRGMARRHQAHMLVLAQYGKGSIREQKDDAPQLHHIEGTDALAHDSHRVWMLDPTKFKAGEPLPEVIPYTLFLRKARKGGLGQIAMGFERRYTRFTEDGPRHQEVV